MGVAEMQIYTLWSMDFDRGSEFADSSTEFHGRSALYTAQADAEEKFAVCHNQVPPLTATIPFPQAFFSLELSMDNLLSPTPGVMK